MREAVRGIIYSQESDDEIFVIKRERESSLYYVFPGGGIEDEDRKIAVSSNFIDISEEIRMIALKREVMEELGIEIEIYQKFDTFACNTYYICKQVGGTIGTGIGEEYNKSNNRGTYIPMCIKISDIDRYNLVPHEIKNKFLEYRKENDTNNHYR